jgi:hypothetical protein
LHALDFDPPSKKSLADAANPENYDVAALEVRVQRALTASEKLRSDLDALPIDAVITDEHGVARHFLTLGSAFAALTDAKATFADIGVTFTDVDAASLQRLLAKAATQGLSDAYPLARVLSDPAKTSLLDQARSVSRRLSAANARAAGLFTEAGVATIIATKVNALLAAGKSVLGEVFNVLSDFRYNNEPDIQLAHADRTQLLKHATKELRMLYPAEEWLHSVAHVRPRAARWNSILSLHETMAGERLELAPTQLPFRAQDSWVAVQLPDKDPQRPEEPFNIAHDTLAVTIHGDAAFAPASTQRGLLIDDWTELLPTRNEITGIAFNYDQPNAAPPQALLLAVSPRQQGQWSWNDLLGIVNDTLLRSKLRAVEPRLLDAVARPEVNVLLPSILADFAQRDLNLALDFRLNIEFVARTAPIQIVAQTTHE